MTEKWALVAPISSTALQELLCTVEVAREEKEDTAEGGQAKKWDIPDYTPRVWRGGTSLGRLW